jgi:hypothetical protein
VDLILVLRTRSDKPHSYAVVNVPEANVLNRLKYTEWEISFLKGREMTCVDGWRERY